MASNITFSIVVPTFNRPNQLEDLLFSLAALHYPSSQFEVVVVDDGGRVCLKNILSRYDIHLNIKYLRQENSGPAMARNYGAVHSEGRFLAFVDDDCVVDPDWLQGMAEGFTIVPLCICGGKTRNGLHRNRYSTASQLLIDYLYEHYNPQNHIGAFFPTNNFGVPRKDFLEVGCFDSSLFFGEDRDFCHRWASHGYPFLSMPSAIVYHAHNLNMLSFLRLHFRYGGGTFQFRKRCIENRGKRIRLSPLSFYTKLIASGVEEKKNFQGIVLSILLLVSQGANTAGFFWEALKTRRLPMGGKKTACRMKK